MELLIEKIWNVYSLCLVSTGFICYLLQRYFPLSNSYAVSVTRSFFKLLKDQFWMWFNFLFVPWFVFSFLNKYMDWQWTSLNSSVMMVWLSEAPMAIRIILFLLVIDFVDYWMHRFLHKFNFLWNFHKMHHGIKEFFWERNQVFHPGEIVFYGLIELLPKLLLLAMMTGEEWVWLALIRLAIGNFAHTSTRVRLGALEKIINNPATHCWHHARRFGGRANFAVTFVFWDILFGTYKMPKEEWPTEGMGFEGSEKYEPAGLRALKFWS
jgi:sterol desaturase/sphingolipid hydroxylase (fatty acid hydroxylase superfamily)